MGTQLPNFAKTQCRTLTALVDFAALLAEKGTDLAAADVFEIIDIPEKCLVVAAGINPVEAGDATTATLTLGDGDDAALYDAGFDPTQVATDGVPVLTSKYYPAADTIDLTLSVLTGTLTTGKVQVWVAVIDVT